MKLIVGPLPPGVYWRRRFIVLGAIVAVLFGFGACLNLVSFSGDDQTGGTKSASGGPSPSGSAKPGSSGSAAAPAGSQQTSGGQNGAQASATGSGSASSPGSGSAAGPTARPATSVSPAPPCEDADMSVVPSAERASYRVGEQPSLLLTLKNVSGRACARDLGADQQEMRIMSGKVRVWSSDDCAPVRGKDVRVLSPGQSLGFRVIWPGTTSNPGCTATRQQVAAGTYQMVARLGSLVSSPVRLVLT